MLLKIRMNNQTRVKKKVNKNLTIHDGPTIEKSSVIGMYINDELLMFTGIPLQFFTKCENTETKETWHMKKAQQEGGTVEWLWEEKKHTNGSTTMNKQDES